MDADGHGALSSADLELLLQDWPACMRAAHVDWALGTFARGADGLDLRAFGAFAACCLDEHVWHGLGGGACGPAAAGSHTPSATPR